MPRLVEDLPGGTPHVFIFRCPLNASQKRDRSFAYEDSGRTNGDTLGVAGMECILPHERDDLGAAQIACMCKWRPIAPEHLSDVCVSEHEARWQPSTACI